MKLEPNTIVVKIDCDDEATPKLISWISHATELMDDNDLLYGNWVNHHRYGGHYPSSGFFIANSSLIQKVGGFNPHILSYGWDDIDLYARMHEIGARMIDAPPYLLHSVPHDCDDRFGNHLEDWKSIDQQLRSIPFKELSNHFSRIVSSITKSKILPVETYSSFSHALAAVGKSLLGEKFDF
jgi:hypothetical protein